MEQHCRGLLGGQYPIDEVVTKWSNLRVQFRSYETKMKVTQSGQGANENKVHWKYFNSMRFRTGASLDKASESVFTLVSTIEVHMSPRNYSFLFYNRDNNFRN